MNAAAASAAVPGPVTLYHRHHVRQQRGKSLGHLMPAVVLVLGLAPLLAGAEPFTPLLAVEVLVGAAYLVLMVRELLHLRHNPFHRGRVAWLELAAAGILALEGYHIWHRHHVAELASGIHKVHTLPWIYGATAIAFVVLAFRMKQFDGRRFLHLHPEGFAVRTTRLGAAHQLRWADVAAVEPVGSADVLVHHVDGPTRRISFAKLHDGPAHRDRLLAHVARQLSGDAESVL